MRRAANRVLADQLGALVAQKRRGEQLRGARRAGVDEHVVGSVIAAVARRASNRFARRPFGFAMRQRAAADEQAREREAAVERAARRAPHVDDQRRGARLRRVRDLRLDLIGRLGADRRDAHVADAGRGDAARDVGRRRRFARQLDDVRIVGVAAE